MPTIEELVWSRHVCNDRTERMMEIMLKIGLGTIEYAFPDDEKKSTSYVTSTGCLLVCQGKFVITAYLLTYRQANALFNKSRIPQALYTQIQKNYKRSTSIRKGKKHHEKVQGLV